MSSSRSDICWYSPLALFDDSDLDYPERSTRIPRPVLAPLTLQYASPRPTSASRASPFTMPETESDLGDTWDVLGLDEADVECNQDFSDDEAIPESMIAAQILPHSLPRSMYDSVTPLSMTQGQILPSRTTQVEHGNSHGDVQTLPPRAPRSRCDSACSVDYSRDENDKAKKAAEARHEVNYQDAADFVLLDQPDAVLQDEDDQQSQWTVLPRISGFQYSEATTSCIEEIGRNVQIRHPSAPATQKKHTRALAGVLSKMWKEKL